MAGTALDAGRQKPRWTALSLGILTFAAPAAILCATFPGNGNDGFADISGSCVRYLLIGIVCVLGAGWLVNATYERADHELLFGSVTVLTALSTVVAFISVFLRRHVADQAGRMFAVLAAVSLLLLVLAAYDWGRRQLMIAAAVTAVALSLFIVRVGFESQKVPPQWERAQIASQATADESALTQEYTDNIAALKKTAMDAATSLGDILYGYPPPKVDGGLLTATQGLYSRAYVLIDQGKADNPSYFSEFDRQAANVDPANPPAAATELTQAVHALRAAESAAAVSASSDELGNAICTVSPPPDGICPYGHAQPITANREWATAKHELDVQLAAYRAQVSGSPADRSHLHTVLAQQPDTDADISILSAVQNGPQTLWRSFFHASGAALVPGPLGWILLGAALLGLLSWLLKANASQLAGPVSVAQVSSAGNGDQLTAALRVAVLLNVAEPGAAPGSSSINPVTTLLDIAAGPLSGVAKVFEAILAVIGRRYGYRVAVDVTSGNLVDTSLVTGGAGTGVKNPAGVTTVLVRVMSLASGTTYASYLCESPDPVDAVRTAGLWAAGNILNRSSRIPHWAAWEAETAHALVTAKNTSEQTVPALKAALADAPNSGVLLVLLGHRYELAGQPLDAIECYARAVTAYPRYAVARYRLATAVAALRHDEYDWRRSESQAESEDSMLRALRSASEKNRINDNDAIAILLGEKDPDIPRPDRELFMEIAEKHLCALERDTLRRYLLVDALRRSERKSLWPALIPMSKHPAARFPALVRSARRAFNDPDTEQLDNDAVKDGSWWQISYNAACRHAADLEKTIRAEEAPAEPGEPAEAPAERQERPSTPEQRRKAAGNAMRFLELTLVRPGVEQLSANWVSRDPDLAVLRAFPRFKRFLAQLRPGE